MTPGKEVWVLKPDRYFIDYMKGFRALGLDARMIEAAEAESRIAAGERPLFVAGYNFGPSTFRHVTGRGIPFVAILLDHWYFSTRQALTERQIGISRALGFSPLVTPLDIHFNPDQPVRQKLPPMDPKRLYVFTIAPEQIPRWKELGVGRAEHVQFGVDARRFRPMELTEEDRRRFGAAVSFFGSPPTLKSLCRKLVTSLSAGQEVAPTPQERVVYGKLSALLGDLVRRQSEDPLRYRMPEILPELEAWHRVHFLEPGGLTPFKETWLMQIGLQYSLELRVALARRLTPLGLAVWGSPSWAECGIDDLDYRGELDWETEAARAINASDININISKIIFPTMVGSRPFEVLACGGFLLTDRYTATDTLFTDGKHLVFYTDFDDLEDKVRYYLAHPRERRDIAERGHRAFLENHTLMHRVRRIVEVLEADGVIPSPAAEPVSA